MKIVDKINAAIAAKQTFFSFEYFPPRTEEVREGGNRACGRAASMPCRVGAAGAPTAGVSGGGGRRRARN